MQLESRKMPGKKGKGSHGEDIQPEKQKPLPSDPGAERIEGREDHDI